MVLERKSMPIVAWYVLSKLSYINLKRDDINTYRTRSGTVPCDKAGLANTLLAQEDQFELPVNGKSQ